MPNGPIKTVGDSTVSVALHTDVVVDITVTVLRRNRIRLRQGVDKALRATLSLRAASGGFFFSGRSTVVPPLHRKIRLIHSLVHSDAARRPA